MLKLAAGTHMRPRLRQRQTRGTASRKASGFGWRLSDLGAMREVSLAAGDGVGDHLGDADGEICPHCCTHKVVLHSADERSQAGSIQFACAAQAVKSPRYGTQPCSQLFADGCKMARDSNLEMVPLIVDTGLLVDVGVFGSSPTLTVCSSRE